jgi:hypothetical protein
VEVSPSLIVTFDTAIKTTFSDTWESVAEAAEDITGVFKIRPGQTRNEYIAFIQDQTGIRDAGQGGNVAYDDVSGVAYKITHTNYNNGLRLTSNEIKDNVWSGEDSGNISAYDFANNKAYQWGAETAVWPRTKFAAMLIAARAGTVTGFDGVNYFATNHPVIVGSSATTYSNIITGVGLATIPTGTAPLASWQDALITNQQHFATAIATIGAISFGGAYTMPRFLRPKYVVHPVALTYTVNQLIGGGGFLTSGPPAQFISQTDNVLRNYGPWGGAIPMPELDAAGITSDYFIVCEQAAKAELGAWFYSELEAFEIRGFPDAASASSNRSDLWEWTVKGRGGAFPGLPWLAYRCTA